MEQEYTNDLPETEQEEVRQSRPRWQRWLAGIALALFLFVLVMYYINLFRGGL